MSRLVARGDLHAAEVCVYRQADLDGDTMTSTPADNADTDYRGFELESLDALELAPWWILQCAQEKAAEIIAQATVQAEQLRQQASCENAAAGRAQALQEVMPSLVVFANAAQSLIVFEEQLISRCTPQIVGLALEIASKVIAKAVDADGEVVAAVLERAKQEALDAKQLRICLNPTDHQLLAELRPDLVKIGNDGKRTIEVVASAEIARGGCRLETESGIVDATLPTQIDEIRRHLLDTEV
ncbi:MAG TPA: FliH/SctL family protein [Candidatus Limnocylindria bacterium]|nr:FliH/SctL family protein [Candidatus Limnocylindria bacterium]